MHLERLEVVDFRSYPEAALDLDPGVTVLIGSNGNGKTNLLEAVGYLADYASHRSGSDQVLVRAGRERALVRARVRRGERTATTDVEIRPGTGGLRVQVNRAPVARPRRQPRLLRAVVFAPEDLGLVRGDPDGRRRLLDDVATTLTPRLGGTRSDYERAARQRTALLRQMRAASPQARVAAGAALDAWDEQLAEAGADLLAGRLRTLAALRPHAVAAYEEVSGGTGPLTLDYDARGVGGGEPEPDRDRLRAALLERAAQRRRDEIDRGVGLVGPHRDELELSVRRLPARSHASHGEAWSVALALRLGAFDLLAATEDEAAQPVLVLDDVFAELDAARRRHLVARAARTEQVLVSVAAAEDVPGTLPGRLIHVKRDPETGCSQVVP